MNTTETPTLTNCPLTYSDTWSRYRQYKNAFNAIDILNYQQINWYPIRTDEFPKEIELFKGSGSDSKLYTNIPNEPEQKSLVVIKKGNILFLQHYDDSLTTIPSINGNIELKIASFIPHSLKRFSGVITVYTISNVITGIELRPELDYISKDENLLKWIKKFYSSSEWQGPKMI